MWNFCFRANTPIPPKKPSVISVPQISVIISYGLVGFRLIQNFFHLMESSEERSLLKQRNAHGEEVDLSSIHTL